MLKIEHLAQVYAASDSGLDIIKSVCPQAADAESKKRAFKLRPDERTASARLYPPDEKCDYWRVVDYGLSEGERWFSPIDLYMMEHGYSPKTDFPKALQELMEEYGVAEELSSKVNRPEIEHRPATADETGQLPRVTFRDGFTPEECAVWGPRVKAEHLTELGWKAVVSVARTKDSETIVTKSTPTFPIFAQTCTYLDSNGSQCTFLKLYEPKNPNKAFRFSIVGTKPKHYLFGLDALRRKFEECGDEKLDEVVLVSGGSDAVNCLSMGCQPVWMGSETEELREEDFRQLLKCAKRVVNVPDIDQTGVKMGIRLALRLPEIHTAWLTPKDMGGLHDNRGRQRKDLKDYILLNPDRKAMRRLIDRSQCAQFWLCHEDKKQPGRYEYSISRTRIDYFLWLNGYGTLADDQHTEPLYIHVRDNVVSRIKAKQITSFVAQWMEEQGLDERLRDKVLRSHDLPNNQTSTLRVRDDLDFSRATAAMQLFYFRNGWVEVTTDGCTLHRYSELGDRFVWKESIIRHDYRQMPPMFTVERLDDGTYHVNFADNPPSKLLHFLVNASRLYWRKEDEEGLELTDAEHTEEHLSLVSKMAAVGYLLHSHKSEAEAWAIICQDSTLGEIEDECNGRSGKSFFLKAVSRMLNAFPLEARVPSVVDNRFLFDGVTEATDLIVVDECHKNLNFDFFFGKITGDLRYEEKGNHPVLIPFARAPKLAFATNYVLRRHDPSTEGRLWPLVFSDFYHVATKKNDYRETRTIRDDFGCNLMGTDYSEADWQADIAFMVQCVQFYLSLSAEEHRIMPPMSRIEKREQMAAVGKDFKQWADDYFAEDSGNLDCEIKCNEVLSSFNAETRFNWSQTKLTQRLKTYCELASHIHCLNPASVTGRKSDGEAWQRRENNVHVRYYYVQSVAKAQTQQPPEKPAELEFKF